MTKIITTVGTSIFTNQTKDKDGKNPDIKSKYDDLDKPNYSFENWNDTQVKEIIDGKQELQQTNGLRKLVSNQIKSNSNASAEIKSILKTVEETQEDAEIYLLATDTVLSVLACELIRDWFNNYKSEEHTITVHFDQTDKFICKGLRVVGKGSSDEFQEKGFFSLIENIKYHKVDILCFSGGYKSIIPFMTLIGQIENLPLYCIYEAPDSELVRVGNLPFSFDWAKVELYHYFLKKENRNALQSFPELKEELEKQKLITSKQKLTVLGELFWKYIDNTPYSFNVFGLFVEYKIYEALIEQPIENYHNNPVLNLTYYLDIETEQITKREIPEDEVGKGIYHPIEYDLILSNSKKEYSIVEVKSYSETSKIDDVIKKSKWKIYTKRQLDDKETLKEFILIIHKFEKQDIRKLNQKLQKLDEELSEIPLKVYYIDIEVNWEKVKINYTNFMKKKLELGKGIISHEFQPQQNAQ